MLVFVLTFTVGHINLNIMLWSLSGSFALCVEAIFHTLSWVQWFFRRPKEYIVYIRGNDHMHIKKHLGGRPFLSYVFFRSVQLPNLLVTDILLETAAQELEDYAYGI